MEITKYRLTVGTTTLCLILSLVGFGQEPLKAVKLAQAKELIAESKKLFLDGSVDSKKALLPKLEEARRLFREADDQPNESYSLKFLGYINNDLGGIYYNLSQYDISIYYYEKSLRDYQELKDKILEGEALHHIGNIYNDLTQYLKAIECFEQALRVHRLSKNQEGEGYALLILGGIYNTLGQDEKARDYYEKSLSKNREINYLFGQSSALMGLGNIYKSSGQYEKAKDYYEQSLNLQDKINDPTNKGYLLVCLGGIYINLGQNNKAENYLEQALTISRKIKDARIEYLAMNFLGSHYFDLGQYEKSKDYFEKSLKISQEIKDRDKERYPLLNLMMLWNLKGNQNLAIFYGKQAINIIQEIRGNLKILDKELQNSFLKNKIYYYRYVSDLLIAQGRLFEAQQVLAMLKEDEYFGYVRRDADEIKKLSARADLRADERAALAKYETLAGKVTEYGTQFAKLEELKNKQGAEFKQQAEYDDLKSNLDAANAAFRIFLEKELVAELGKPVKKEIETDRALQTKLQQWGSGTVALYTVAGDDRYRVILTTPKTQVDGKTEIKIADLNKKIFDFRAALQNPAVDPRPLGKELYDILIKPVEKDLAAAEAKTLLWSLDGTLRYVPFAALSPDGVHYLAEKYQNVVITSTTRQSLLAETDPNWRVLGAGVTKESRLTEPNGGREIFFSALPEVGRELLKIVSSEDAQTKENGLLAGRRLIDEKFDLAALEGGMSRRTGAKPRYNVVHLATHFRLGNDSAQSFLLLGNNQALTLEKVSDSTALNFGDVELVALSACNTGFGTAIENKTANKEQERQTLEANNGAEVDSLATFIELRGAKAVLASLWAVADESTQLLMSEFYRLRKENPQLTKADALQLAQQSMIAGNLKSSGKTIGCRSEIVKIDGTKQTAYKCDGNAPFAHPYFWSPFVLIGNWR